MYKSFSITFAAKLYSRIITLLLFAYLARKMTFVDFGQFSFLWVLQNSLVPLILFGSNVLLIVNTNVQNYIQSIKVISYNFLLLTLSFLFVDHDVIIAISSAYFISIVRVNVAYLRGLKQIKRAETGEQLIYSTFLAAIMIVIPSVYSIYWLLITSVFTAVGTFFIVLGYLLRRDGTIRLELRHFYKQGLSLFASNLSSYLGFSSLRLLSGFIGNALFVGQLQPVFQLGQSSNLLTNAFKLTVLSEEKFSIQRKTRVLLWIQYLILLFLTLFGNRLISILYGPDFVFINSYLKMFIVPLSLNVVGSVFVSIIIKQNEHIILRYASLIGIIINISLSVLFLLQENYEFAFIGSILGISMTNILVILSYMLKRETRFRTFSFVILDYAAFILIYGICIFFV